MQELIPLFAGAVVGLVVAQIPGWRVRAVALVALCFLIGGLVSYLVGELESWWGFIAFDALLVWAGAIVAVLAASWWRGRTRAARR